MVFKVYAVRNSKSENFFPPLLKRTHGEVERELETAVNSPDSFLSKYPEDFDLYHLGEWDDNSGKFTLLDSPVHLLKAIQLKKQATVSSLN